MSEKQLTREQLSRGLCWIMARGWLSPGIDTPVLKSAVAQMDADTALLAERDKTIAQLQPHRLVARCAELSQALADRDATIAALKAECERTHLRLAGCLSAAEGYWKEGDPIHPDYYCEALRVTAKLYAAYREAKARVEELEQALTELVAAGQFAVESVDDVAIMLRLGKATDTAKALLSRSAAPKETL